MKRLTSLQQSSMYIMRRTTSSAPLLAELAASAGMEDSSSGAGASVPATPLSEGMDLADVIDDDPEFVAQASEHMWVAPCSAARRCAEGWGLLCGSSSCLPGWRCPAAQLLPGLRAAVPHLPLAPGRPAGSSSTSCSRRWLRCTSC